MSECPHYRGESMPMHEPMAHEKFKRSRKVCVCFCGVALGWITPRGEIKYNPILSEAQKVPVARFLGVATEAEKAYQRDYYQRVTKPKREEARRLRLAED